ncbi:general transcription factor 3C polypeptide 3 (transcription factor C subunit 4) [Schistosoma bovis]|uniref:General transcription factor 3C polypeptide 3 (Transcription factor C subunit 4) n=1 Tax=Schistosoma bovis TaxID=6184 RepID=A0A430QKH4_SCHBO|nr:general transcription factor 3C polypeptide 3 (transcription factor C subunit 4) [Schistosoma bovis]
MDAEHSDDWGVGGELELAQDFEVIDLNEFDSSCGYVSEADDSTYISSFLNGLVTDETLYSRYLNGIISFDDLMREMHHSTTVDNDSCHSSDSDCSSKNDDSEYSTRPRRSKRRQNPDTVGKKKLKLRGPLISKRARLPIELAQYLGEAERHLNNDEFEHAERICYQIIDTAPQASQPYIVLAEISFRRGNQEKAKEFLYQAAQRNPSDKNTWLTLVDWAEEAEDFPLAIHYARQALRRNRADTSLRQRLIDLCHVAGRSREALQLRLAALSVTPESTDRNSALSILFQMKRYDQALKFFTSFCGVKLYLNSGDLFDMDRHSSKLSSVEKFKRCEFPDNMPVELQLKLFLIFAHLGLGPLVVLVQVWTLLAECYLEAGETESAIKAYRHVIENLDPRHTGARLGLVNLLRRLGRNQEALKFLNPSNLVQKGVKPEISLTEQCDLIVQKREKSPLKSSHRSTVRSFVSSDLRKTSVVGDIDSDECSVEKVCLDSDWLDASANLVSRDHVAYRLAYERCRMLDTPESVDSFLEEAWALLFSDVTRVCGPRFTQLALTLDSEQHRKLVIDRLASVAPALTDTLSNQIDAERSTTETNGVSSSDIWGLFLRVVDVLRARLPKSLPQLETATAWASLLPHVQGNDLRRLAASHLLISSSLIARHGTPAFLELRKIQKQDSLNLAIGTIASSDTLVRGSYRYAIGKSSYSTCFHYMIDIHCCSRLINMREKFPDDALLTLLLAVGFLSMSMQKHIGSRHLAVLQAVGFLGEYKRLRGDCQEVYYNIARACHQLSITHMAIHYYEKVLDMEPIGNNPEEKSLTNLYKEAAFNLALLYRTNGNPSMARHILQKYVII